MKAHPRTKMLVYYQDFGDRNPFRIQGFPQSRAVLKRALNSRRFPPLAPNYPKARRTSQGAGPRSSG